MQELIPAPPDSPSDKELIFTLLNRLESLDRTVHELNSLVQILAETVCQSSPLAARTLLGKLNGMRQAMGFGLSPCESTVFDEIIRRLKEM